MPLPGSRVVAGGACWCVQFDRPWAGRLRMHVHPGMFRTPTMMRGHLYTANLTSGQSR